MDAKRQSSDLYSVQEAATGRGPLPRGLATSEYDLWRFLMPLLPFVTVNLSHRLYDLLA